MWNPTTRRNHAKRSYSERQVPPGQGFPGLSASKKRVTSREVGREPGTVNVDRAGHTNEDANGILEGEHKVKSGTITDR